RAVELCARSRGEHGRWAAPRHGERERAPAADSIAVGVDLAAVGLDESLGNRQPDTGSAVLTVARPVDSVKAVEQSDQVLRGNTVPGIGHGHDDGFINRVRRNDDVVFVMGMAQSVVEEIRQDLPETLGIGPYPWEVRRDM